MAGGPKLARLNRYTGALLSRLGADARRQVNEVDIPPPWWSGEHEPAASVRMVKTAVALKIG
jgi:hypothetical protein